MTVTLLTPSSSHNLNELVTQRTPLWENHQSHRRRTPLPGTVRQTDRRSLNSVSSTPPRAWTRHTTDSRVHDARHTVSPETAAYPKSVNSSTTNTSASSATPLTRELASAAAAAAIMSSDRTTTGALTGTHLNVSVEGIYHRRRQLQCGNTRTKVVASQSHCQRCCPRCQNHQN